jgi:hypothetical protein
MRLLRFTLGEWVGIRPTIRVRVEDTHVREKSLTKDQPLDTDREDNAKEVSLSLLTPEVWPQGTGLNDAGYQAILLSMN